MLNWRLTPVEPLHEKHLGDVGKWLGREIAVIGWLL